MPLKILIADFSNAVRSNIRRLLQADAELEVIGEATTLAQAIERTSLLKPDVVLLDLMLPHQTNCLPKALGQELLAHAGCVLAMSVWITDEAHAHAARLGATGLLNKSNLDCELIPSIRAFCSTSPH